VQQWVAAIGEPTPPWLATQPRTSARVLTSPWDIGHVNSGAELIPHRFLRLAEQVAARSRAELHADLTERYGPVKTSLARTIGFPAVRVWLALWGMAWLPSRPAPWRVPTTRDTATALTWRATAPGYLRTTNPDGVTGYLFLALPTAPTPAAAVRAAQHDQNIAHQVAVTAPKTLRLPADNPLGRVLPDDLLVRLQRLDLLRHVAAHSDDDEARAELDAGRSVTGPPAAGGPMPGCSPTPPTTPGPPTSTTPTTPPGG
jgi:hypothetical protein